MQRDQINTILRLSSSLLPQALQACIDRGVINATDTVGDTVKRLRFLDAEYQRRINERSVGDGQSRSVESVDGRDGGLDPIKPKDEGSR